MAIGVGVMRGRRAKVQLADGSAFDENVLRRSIVRSLDRRSGGIALRFGACWARGRQLARVGAGAIRSELWQSAFRRARRYRLESYGTEYVWTVVPARGLPRWLTDALDGAALSRCSADGDPTPAGPDLSVLLARTSAPVNWPALIAEHPNRLVVDGQWLASRRGPQWSAISSAYERIVSAGCTAAIDVALMATADGRITVCPLRLLAFDAGLTESCALVGEVNDLLAPGITRAYGFERWGLSGRPVQWDLDSVDLRARPGIWTQWIYEPGRRGE